eukprot:9491353-Alexandrium_andersonii.AAC.1
MSSQAHVEDWPWHVANMRLELVACTRSCPPPSPISSQAYAGDGKAWCCVGYTCAMHGNCSCGAGQ